VVSVRRTERVNVMKGHKSGRSARAAVRQTIAEAAMRGGAFRVPRLLAHDGRVEALVFEFLPGREVELGRESAGAYGELGRRLRAFQDHDEARDLGVFGVRDELAVLDKWRAKVERVAALPEGWGTLRARLERQATDLPAPHLGLCHRDLHDRQVHSDGSAIALLDFDLLCCADVALDPGNLAAHLAWRAVQGQHGADGTSARALERALLEGLARRSEPGFEARFSFWRASALLRLALVYRLRPRWSPLVHELVTRASAALDDLAPLVRSPLPPATA
jgi:Ser/Thr protein kinase RdoA (MazF antagonist)